LAVLGSRRIDISRAGRRGTSANFWFITISIGRSAWEARFSEQASLVPTAISTITFLSLLNNSIATHRSRSRIAIARTHKIDVDITVVVWILSIVESGSWSAGVVWRPEGVVKGK